MNIGARIKEERERINLTQQQFADHLGIGKRTVWEWEKGSTYPNAIHLANLDEIGINTHYIVTGRKNHLKNNRKKGKNEVSECDEYVYIPVYDVEVSAGFGREVNNEDCTKHHAFRKRWVDYHGYNPSELIVVKAVGDSMSPVIHDGAFLVVNREKNNAVNGKVFVIRVRSELKVKYIETRLNGDLVLRSANPFYEDEVLTPALLASEDIEIIGEVVHGSRDF